jgi:hypothetical protein
MELLGLELDRWGGKSVNADTAKKLHGRDEFRTTKEILNEVHTRQNRTSALMAPVCTSTMSNEPLELAPKVGHIDYGRT